MDGEIRALNVGAIPPYLLGSLAETILELRNEGNEVVDLSQVNPEVDPPRFGVDKIIQYALRPENHRYSSSSGISRLRESCAHYYRNRYGVELDPGSEIVTTMGAKEGVFHLMLASLGVGEHVLLPTPGYPIHNSAVFIARGTCVSFSLGESVIAEYSRPGGSVPILTAESDEFFVNLRRTLDQITPQPRFLVCGFPHNPTGVVATKEFFCRLVDFAREHDVVIVHDNAYQTIGYDGYRTPSIMEAPGAKDCAVELFSMSKGFGIAGWRVGFMVGNPRLVAALKKVKSYVDFGIWQPLQLAACAVLDRAGLVVEELNQDYQSRRDVLVGGLEDAGWQVKTPLSTLFTWARIPEAHPLTHDSMRYAHALLRECHVAVCPGRGFGLEGEGFLRVAFSARPDVLRTAVERIAIFSGSPVKS